MRNFIKNIFITSIVFSLIVFTSCEVGLGESLDLKGPTVTIISPEARENVMEVFNISGKVTDDFEVGVVTVTLDDNVWKHDGNSWLFKAKGSDNFVKDDKSTWNSTDNGKAVDWTIKDASISGSGTFTIVVNALDKTGNSSEESKKQRDVIIDKSAPVITISSPNLKQDETEYTNIADYKDITKINMFITSDFTISGKTTEENAIKYVDLIIKDKDGTQEYYKKRILQDEKYKNESDYTGAFIKVDNLRSWDVDIVLSECDLKNLDENKNVLKILTITEDTAGNKTTLLSHGYTCLWKAADKPWIEINLGTQTNANKVYAGSKIMANAYDDSKITSITATVRKSNSTGAIVDGYANKVLYDGTNEEENIVFFELPVPAECTTYYVEITAKDDNENSDTINGYIQVVDKTWPSIEVSHSVGGEEKSVAETLFGDSNGNFSFNITAKDDTEVKSVKMVYVTTPTGIIDYATTSYTGWNTTSANKSDLKNGKVLDLTLSLVDSGTENVNGITKKVYKTTVTDINIFDDLGIDGSTRLLSNQSFVFRVEDGNSNALTLEYTIRGDIEPPSIEFSKIIYYPNGVSEGNGIIYTDTSEKLNAFSTNTEIEVYGKINEDSFLAWGGYQSCIENGKLNFKLTVNESELSLDSIEADGSFKATARNLTGSSLIFDASLADYNANQTSKKYSFLVDTYTPKVTYISSDNSDGYYNTGREITMYLRLNKAMIFTKGTANPTLTLNNDATATMVMDNESDYENTVQLKFKYTVKSGEDTTGALNVKNYDLKGGKIEDANNKDVTSEIKKSLNELILVNNLASMKKIYIITSVPTLTSAKIDETTGILTLTYNKKIAKGQGNVTITQQKSHGNASGDGVDFVPAVLTSSEYAKSPEFAKYYEETTNGTDSSFVPDTSAKYLLKYAYDTDNSTIIGVYTGTGAHIISQNIKSNKVKITNSENSENSYTVSIELGANPLPCKGANYRIEIDAGFVQDFNGGAEFSSAKIGGNDGLAQPSGWPYTAAGIEAPVIRIKKDSTTVKDFVATQPLKAEFKIDCETPNAALTYSYDEYTRSAFTVTGNGSNTRPTYWPNNSDNSPNDVSKGVSKVINNSNSKSNVSYERKSTIEIGNNNYQQGLEYQITATATGNNSTSSAYDAAYRTVIELVGTNGKMNDVLKKDHGTNWPYNENTAPAGIFIRGDSNPNGASTVKGLPTDWNTTHYTKVCLLTKSPTDVENTETYYFTSWAITTNYYFMFLGGLMDNSTNTDANGDSLGPKYGNYGIGEFVSFYSQYPVCPGGYAQINNKSENEFNFDFSCGKEQMYR